MVESYVSVYEMSKSPPFKVTILRRVIHHSNCYALIGINIFPIYGIKSLSGKYIYNILIFYYITKYKT